MNSPQVYPSTAIPRKQPAPASCEANPEVSSICGPGRSYYIFPQGGHRMAVAVLDEGTKIRLNDTMDIVVLGVHDGAVELGVALG